MIDKDEKILLVIKDNLEYKNLVDSIDFFCTSLLGTGATRTLYICSTVNSSDIFRKEVKALFNSNVKVRFISWPEGNLYFEKAIMAVRNFLFYLYTFNESFSSRQKLLIYLGFKESFVYKLNLSDVKVPSVLSNLSRCVSLLFRKYFKRNSDTIYDKVILFRTDSSHNIKIYNDFVGERTCIISFVRNIDTITLKGVFSIPSDITIVNSKRQAEILNRLHSKSDYGTVIINNKTIEVIKKGKSCKAVFLYATSHPRFVPKEHLIVERLYKSLSENYKGAFEFHLRLHPADNDKRYQLPPDVNFHTTNKTYVQYIINGKKNNFFDINSIKKYYSQLSCADVLLSCTSSIFTDAISVNVPRLIYINDQKYFDFPSLYYREHLQEILEYDCVELCNDVSDLKL